MNRSIRIVVTTVFVALAAVPFGATAARASGATIQGAGSTWSQIALDQWRADVARQGLNVQYAGVGSSAGRMLYVNNNVDFAVSEIPFMPEELHRLNRSYQYLPIVAGGTSMMYNLATPQGKRITNLQLASPAIAGIFTGKITTWNDPMIRRSNPGLSLPNIPIKPVIRSDGSGTSAQFSAYIHAEQPATWASFARQWHIPNTYTSFWPNFPNSIAQKGSDGVANYVANPTLGIGAIGYVEAGYALQRSFPVVSVLNKSGRYTLPTAQNVATALDHATIYKDNTQNLTGVYAAPEATAYPISSYSYMITPTNDISSAKGATLGKFILYFACAGQQSAAPLGYSPLPPSLVQLDFQALTHINGAPKPPPLNSQTCPNPTVTGSFGHHSGPSGPGVQPTPTTHHSIGPSPHHSAKPSKTTQTTAAPTTTVAPSSTIKPLRSASILAMQRAAAEQTQGARTSSSLPLFVAAIVVLLLVFGPLFLHLRSR